ncbi:MAG: DUF3786 domain-containing protein [Thermoplasmata archaeon]|nr:MAG: DUF3786 domain-containing protein [Thermoplasmata archaeon]
MKREDTHVLTERKPESYISALAKAWEELTVLEPLDIADRSLATYNEADHEFTITFFSQDYRIQLEKRVVLDPDGKEARPLIAVLLIHYLAYAKDVIPKGKLITFRELEGGDVYYDAFTRRAIIPITRTFGQTVESLKEAAKSIQAEEAGHGDFSLKIMVLPKIPVWVIVWEGDDEVPASSNMLFDATIKELLPTEDVAVIGGFVASMLIKNRPKWHDDV